MDKSLLSLDFWSLVGGLGTLFYFGRLVIQWWLSEKAKRPVLPGSYWYLSLLGALLLFIYSLAREDLVFLVNYLVPLAIYVRQMVLHRRHVAPISVESGPCPHCGNTQEK